MLYWALVEQARHKRMSNEYKNRYIIMVPSSPSLVKVRDTTVGVPSELIEGGKSSGQTLISQTRIVDPNY